MKYSKKIIFDANMVYNYLNLRNVSVERATLVDFILKNQCYISSVTLIEVLVYCKNNYSAIKQLSNSFGEHFAYIDFNYVPFDNTNIESIRNSSELNDIADVLGNAYDLKIKREAEVTQLYLYASLIVISWCIVESNKNMFNDSKQIQQVLTYFDAILKGNAQNLLANCENILLNGYKTKIGPQALMKKDFSRSVDEFFKLLIFMFYCGIHNLNIHDVSSISEEQYNAVFEGYGKDSLLKLFIEKGSISAVLKNQKYKEIVISTTNELIEVYTEYPIFKDSKLVLTYFKKKLFKIFFDGSNFKTNDIFDMLNLYTLDAFNNEALLLTHDKEVDSILISMGISSITI